MSRQELDREPLPDPARPPTEESAAALPLNVREGTAPVAVTGEYEVAALVTESLPRTIVRIGLPAVASSLLMTTFAFVDAFWVGTRIGPAGLAAVSTSLFWIWMLISLAEMVGVGLTAVASRRHGERRSGEAARVVGEALVFSLLLGITVAIAGVMALPSLFAVMQTPPEVTALGMRYLGTYLVGSPLIYGFFAVDAGFRASGDTRTPFVLLTCSVAVTLVLDPILILGLGPAPELGIAGAAIATVATRGTVFAMGLALLHRRALIRLTPVRRATVAAIARIGMPTAATGVSFSLIYVAITRTTTDFGTPALAALGVGHRIESWLYMIGVGFGAATAAIVGQNLGARRPDRAERTGWLAVGYASSVGIVAFTAQLVFAEEFARVFSADPDVVATSASYLRIAAISQLFISSELILEGALGGAGDTIPPMLASTSITLSRIPLAAWAAARWGVDGIWWVIAVTAVARGVAMMLLWRHGGWKRKSV